jgi:predicted regulator of Ras-like GTPase activity (Roadblock/LC7/MglB family)
VESLIITDKDSVIIFSQSVDNVELQKSRDIASWVSLSTEQAAKLNMGTCDSITTFSEGKTQVYLTSEDWIAAFIGDVDMNVGHILEQRTNLMDVLGNLRVGGSATSSA